jgi:hypothetical protein
MARLVPVCSAIHFGLQRKVSATLMYVWRVVKRTWSNLEHSQNVLEFTPKLVLVYGGRAQVIGKDVILGPYVQRENRF